VQVAAKPRYSDNPGASNGIEHTPLAEYQSLPWSVRETRIEGKSVAQIRSSWLCELAVVFPVARYIIVGTGGVALVGHRCLVANLAAPGNKR
jgi:hypothetical protein